MYTVFVDDGLDEVFNDHDKTKRYAAKTHKALRAECRKDSYWFKKLTKEEEKLFK